MSKIVRFGEQRAENNTFYLGEKKSVGRGPKTVLSKDENFNTLGDLKRRVGANKLNKHSRTADEGWSSSLGVGRGSNNPPVKNIVKKRSQVRCLPGDQTIRR